MSNITKIPSVHPVATTTLGATTLATTMIWVAGRLGANLTAEEGAIITAMVGTLIALIGRKGLTGIWESILHGNQAKEPE